MNRRELLKAAALSAAGATVANVPVSVPREVATGQIRETVRTVAADGAWSVEEYTYEAETSHGRWVDLTPYGNRVPDFLVPIQK
ncbi:MAG: twin-arginine translocation signal domain-containing protein [bacterium]|nr:twin-arginine translocation signal domain-containing protein [bacterium]